MTETKRRIFIGGTGRSGTSILAHALKVHPDVIYYPEPRFMEDWGGVNSYLDGVVSLEKFRIKMLTDFRDVMLRHLGNHGYPKAVAALSRAEMERLFHAHYSSEGVPLEMSAEFIDALFTLGMEAEGKSHWMQKDPHTVTMADKLYRMFPDMRYIHIIRDPRDVCSSLFEQNWGPKTVDEFVEFWLSIMNSAMRARKSIDDDHYLTITLDSLTKDPREGLGQVYEFVGLSCDDSVLDGGASMFNSDEMHDKRWVGSLEPSDVSAIERACGPSYSQWKEFSASPTGT